MGRDLRIAYRIVVAMLAAAEVLSFSGVIAAPHRILFNQFTTGIGGFEWFGMFCAVLYAFARPPRRELYAVVTGAMALAALAALVLSRPGGEYLTADWVIFAAVGAGAAVLIALLLRIGRGSGDVALAKDLLAACGLVVLANLAVAAFVNLSIALLPATFDLAAYRFDATLGLQPSVLLRIVADLHAWIDVTLRSVYHSLGYCIPALYALQRSSRQRMPAHIMVVMPVLALSALLLYHLYPVAGPRYAFGSAFPASMPPALELVQQWGVVIPAARNGMPSAHFGWAVLMWLNAGYLGSKFARAAFALFAGLTVLATLAMGEHYLVDLVVAIPLVVAIQALCTTVVGWEERARRDAVLWGFGLTLAWIVALRYGFGAFVGVPGLSWAAVLATIATSVALYRPLARATAAALLRPAPAQPAEASVPARTARREMRLVAAMFVISGFAALMYQVLFSKTLALTFGSTATATYTVLATYMGGMALGAWLGGRLASHRDNALRLYAWCELGIGMYCVATPFIFKGVQAMYVVLASGVPPDAGVLTALRVALGAGVLTVPTVLMGMTLPILAKYFEPRAASLGTSVAVLYGANTLGAAVGALAAGYVIIPMVGVSSTTLLAALANFAVALMALRLGRAQSAQAQPRWVRPEPAYAPGIDGSGERRLGFLAFVLLAAGGIVTLALEVNYMHLLAVVAGNSVYAFSLMLFVFLLGLGAGAEIARHLLRLKLSLPLVLAWLEFGLAAVILAGVFLWDGLPEYFAQFAIYPKVYEFGAREVVRGAVCAVAMFPPAVAIGALYPLAMECVGRAFPQRPVEALGRAAALNTLGNIVGVLAAGFVLLPAIGALRSIQLLALLCLLLGLLALAVSAQRYRAWAWTPAGLVVALLAVQPGSFDYTALAAGTNVYFAPNAVGRVIDHAESVDGGLTTVSEVHGSDGFRLLTLYTNGKFQGNNATGGEMRAQVGIALSPLLHTAARERALVIGFGTGVSARTLHAAGFQRLDIVDLSADIIRLADTHFSNVNDHVIGKSGVDTYVTDGRNFLLLQERKFDVVSMEISSIWFAGAASLYNREFYQLVKRRMPAHGVLQQWMQLHHTTPIDILYILGTVRAEFEYVWLYLIGGQGMIIASNDAQAQPHLRNVAVLDARDSLKPLLAINGGTAANLLKTRLLDPAGTDKLLDSTPLPASYWVSTDDNLFLEYNTPRGNVLDTESSLKTSYDFIRSFAGATITPKGN